MRYELREYKDTKQKEFVVKASSDSVDTLQKMRNRASIPNDTWYNLYIFDTQTQKNV